jgi:hypothetical protein
MTNPRQQIETLMLSKLAAIGPGNGDNVPKAVWQVLTEQRPITEFSDDFRPTIILLTEQGESEFVGIGGVKQTPLSVAVLIYLTVRSIDEGQVVCTQYADAVTRCFDMNREWGGLALVTEMTGTPLHQLLTLPDAIVTVNAEVRYMHESFAA